MLAFGKVLCRILIRFKNPSEVQADFLLSGGVCSYQSFPTNPHAQTIFPYPSCAKSNMKTLKQQKGTHCETER